MVKKLNLKEINISDINNLREDEYLFIHFKNYKSGFKIIDKDCSVGEFKDWLYVFKEDKLILRVKVDNIDYVFTFIGEIGE